MLKMYLTKENQMEWWKCVAEGIMTPFPHNMGQG